MAILSGQDFIKLEKEGRIRIPERTDFSAFSLNVHIDKLYRRLETKAATIDEQALPQQQFLAELCQEISFDQGIVIAPRDFYLWQPREEIFLADGLAGEITSRSGWARLGIRVQSKGVDDYLHRYQEAVTLKPLGTLITTGTSVHLQRGAALGQLFVDDGPEFCTDDEMVALIDEGAFAIKREGQAAKSTDLEFNQGLSLTLGNDLLIYQRGTLSPGNIQEGQFQPQIITRTNPYYFSQGSFFISASRESVEIPAGYVGYVVERDPQHFLLPFASHPNAPYIGPKSVFNGKITFENYMVREGYVQEGMRQSKLLLKPLRTSLENYHEQSRYNHQTKATASRL